MTVEKGWVGHKQRGGVVIYYPEANGGEKCLHFESLDYNMQIFKTYKIVTWQSYIFGKKS